jgi:hypothetical protein
MSRNTVNEQVREIIGQYKETPFRYYTNEIFNGYGNLRIYRPRLLLRILKDPTVIEKVRTKAQTKLNNKTWDKPRIVSVLNLETEKKEEFKGFDYNTEVKAVTKYFLKQNNGTLCESPKRVWRRIQDCKSTKETLDILTEVLKPSADREERRLSSLRDLDGFPTDEFLIAKYLSANDKVIAKVWDRDPKKDMSTGDELWCCTMPTCGPDYLVDSNVSMLDFFAVGKRYARAILVACKDEKDKVLVVDSIEGTQRFMDNHDGKKDSICRFMANSIEKQGSETGFDSVVYNVDCINMIHIYRQIFDRISVDERRQILKPVFRKRVVYTDSYLETLYLRKSPRGYTVVGKKIKVGDLDEN